MKILLLIITLAFSHTVYATQYTIGPLNVSAPSGYSIDSNMGNMLLGNLEAKYRPHNGHFNIQITKLTDIPASEIERVLELSNISNGLGLSHPKREAYTSEKENEIGVVKGVILEGDVPAYAIASYIKGKEYLVFLVTMDTRNSETADEVFNTLLRQIDRHRL